MGLPELHDVFPARFNSWSLNQVENQSYSPGVEAMMAQAGGTVDPALEAIAAVDPRWNFQSRDVQNVLQNVAAMTGLQITSGAKMQHQKRLQAGAGIFAGAGNHFVLSSTIGFLMIQEFGFEQNAKEGGDISLQFIALFDGTNAPVQVNVSQSLLGSPAVNAVHAMGPVLIEGTQVTGVQKWRFKTGLEAMIQAADGETASRIAAISKRAPSLEIDLINQSFLSSLSIGPFKRAISQPTTCYAQRVLAGGDRYAWNQSQHIAVAISEGTISCTDVSNSKGGNATTKITVMATNNNVSVTPATTISV